MKAPNKAPRKAISEKPLKRMPLRLCNSLKNASESNSLNKNVINQNESVISNGKKSPTNKKISYRKVETKLKQSTQIKKTDINICSLIKKKNSNKENITEKISEAQNVVRNEHYASVSNNITKVTTRSQGVKAKVNSILVKELLVNENFTEEPLEVKKNVCYKNLAATPKRTTTTCHADVYDIFLDNDLDDASLTRKVKKRKIKCKENVRPKKLKKLPTFNLKKPFNFCQLKRNCDAHIDNRPLRSKNVVPSENDLNEIENITDQANRLQTQIPTKSLKNISVVENSQNVCIHNESNLNTIKDTAFESSPNSQAQICLPSANSVNNNVLGEISVLDSLNLSLHSDHVEELENHVELENYFEANQLINQHTSLKEISNDTANILTASGCNNSHQKQTRVNNVLSENIDFYAEFEASFSMMHSTPEKKKTENSPLHSSVKKRIFQAMDVAQISPICEAMSSSGKNKDAQIVLESPENIVANKQMCETDGGNIIAHEHISECMESDEQQCIEITLYESPVKIVPEKRTSPTPENEIVDYPNINLREGLDESMSLFPEMDTVESPQKNVTGRRSVNYKSIVLFEDTIVTFPDIKEKVLKPKKTYSTKSNKPKKNGARAGQKKKTQTKNDKLAAALNDHFEEIEKLELCIER